MIESNNGSLSTRKQCSLLEVNRASHYYTAQEANQSDALLMNEIKEVWLRRCFYGYRRITKELQSMGHEVNRKRVLRLMRKMGLQALYPKPKISLKNQEHKTYPYVLKDLAIGHSNQAWQVDITYLQHQGGFMYLVALIDVHSRYVVSWELSNTLDTDFCLTALKKGLKYVVPEIVNSDQGCQFTSKDWVGVLIDAGIKVSMTGKGRCHDNIYIERFWRAVKYEEIYLNDYDTVNELKSAIDTYIKFYNNERWHQSLGYKTPAEVYYNSQKEPMHMMDNASALPTSTQAQLQRVIKNKGSENSLN
jgi:putative transposase